MAAENELSPEEQHYFAERLAQLGMDESHIVAALVTGSTAGATVLSEDPGIDSAVKPVMLVINSPAEAQRLGGSSGALFDSIESLHFPLAVGAFAIQNVTVSAGHPLVLAGANQAYNFGVVTIEAGGEIHITAGNVAMTCQKIISMTAQF